jgi:hypothetical protein
MSRRILIAQEPFVTASGIELVVPVSVDTHPTAGLTAAIRLAGSLDPEGAVRIDAAPPPRAATRCTDVGAGETELAAPDDFAPATGRGRVVVTGRVVAAAPATRIPLRVTIGDASGAWLCSRGLWVECASASTSLPLTEAFLRGDDGGTTPALGPQRGGGGGLELGQGTLEPGGWIELEGVVDEGRVLVRVPHLRPRLVLDEGAVELACELVHVALPERRIALHYRACILPSPASVLVLLFDDRPVGRARELCAGAHLAFAVERDGVAEPPDAAELAAARLDTGASPRLPFESYVRAAAALMEQPVDRAAVLAAVGMSEDRWIAEETAWAMRMGDEAMAGDPSLCLCYGEILTFERERLAGPDEERAIEEYARIRAELEQASEPGRVLEAHRLTLPAWFRLDAHWEAAVAGDDGLARRLDDLLVTERERLDRRREPEPTDAQLESLS